MDRLNEILQERAARLSVTAGCFNVRTAGQDYSLTHDRCFIDSAKLFQDLLAVMNKYDYRATPEELRILKECGAGAVKIKKSHDVMTCHVQQTVGLHADMAQCHRKPVDKFAARLPDLRRHEKAPENRAISRCGQWLSLGMHGQAEVIDYTYHSACK